MTWEDQPVQPAQPIPPPTSESTRIGGLRRGIVVGTMALGLLVVGGVAAVSAADPSASASPSARTTQPANPGTTDPSATAHPKGNCPEDGANRGSRGSGGSSPEASPDASPDASSSDA